MRDGNGDVEVGIEVCPECDGHFFVRLPADPNDYCFGCGLASFDCDGRREIPRGRPRKPISELRLFVESFGMPSPKEGGGG